MPDWSWLFLLSITGIGGLAGGTKAGHRINQDTKEERSDQLVTQS
jgi:hypothetical protein